MIYIDRDDLDLAFFIAENKLRVATSFKILSDALLIRGPNDGVKTINTDDFWDALALDILNHENPVLAKRAANSLLSLWLELSGLYYGRGTGLSDRTFSPRRIKNLAMADNFFVEMNDLIQSVNVTQNFIDKQNPTKKSKP